MAIIATIGLDGALNLQTALANNGNRNGNGTTTAPGQIKQESGTSVNVDTRAQVLSNISLRSQALNFGKFTVSNTTAGTIVVGASGTIGDTAGTTYVGGGGIGGITIAGGGGQQVQLTVTDVSNLTGPGGAMSLSNVNFGKSGSSVGTSPTVTLDNNGSGNLDIFGTLNVAAAQTPGQYAGTITVTATYI